MQVKKDLSPWIFFPEHHRKQVLARPGKMPSFPLECNLVLPESQIYEFSCWVFIFIFPAAWRKMRIILEAKLSIQGFFFLFNYRKVCGLGYYSCIFTHKVSLSCWNVVINWLISVKPSLVGSSCLVFLVSLKPGCNIFWSWRLPWLKTPGREVHGKPGCQLLSWPARIRFNIPARC